MSGASTRAARCGAALVSLGLIITALAASPATADVDLASPWSRSRPVNLDHRATQDVFDYQLGSAPDGTAVAVWTRFNLGKRLRIEGARRPPGGDWTRPTLIGRIDAVGGSALGNIVVDGAGNATVAFTEYVDYPVYRGMVRTWRSDGTLEQTVVLYEGGGFGHEVYGDPEGDLAAINSSGRVYTRPYGGEWHEVEALPDSSPRLALGPGSRVDAVWRTNGGVFTTSLKGGTWGPPRQLGGAIGWVNGLDIVANASGDTGVIWMRFSPDDSEDDVVWSSFRRAGSSEWSGAERVNRGPESEAVAADSAEVDLAADGTMTVAWREVDRLHQYDTHQPVLAATRSPTGKWIDPAPVGMTGRYLRVCLSVNAAGAASIVTRTEDETGDLRWLVAAQRPPGSDEWTTSRVTKKLHWLEGSWLTVDGLLTDAGEAIAVYQRTETDHVLRSKAAAVG